MNYIKKLQKQVEAQQAEIAALRAGLNSLRVYMHSPKFSSGDRLDGYVNVGDVLAYVRNAETAGSEARELIG